MSLEDAMNQPAEDETLKNTSEQESPEVVEDDEQDDLPQLTELEVLQKRADQLGLRYRSNTGVEKLRKMVNDAIEGNAASAEEEDEVEPAKSQEPEVTTQEETNVQTTAAPLTARQVRNNARNEARKLVRVRITCHNPAKSEWEGELLTFGNSVVGTIKRYVPYEVEWHVEQALLNMLRARKYQHFYNVRENGRDVRQTKLVNEFSIELLEPLTEAEIKELAQRQAMSQGTQE